MIIPGMIQKFEFGSASVQNLDQTLVGLKAVPVDTQLRCREVQSLRCQHGHLLFNSFRLKLSSCAPTIKFRTPNTRFKVIPILDIFTFKEEVCLLRALTPTF